MIRISLGILFFLILIAGYALPLGGSENPQPFVYDPKGKRDPFLPWGEREGGNKKTFDTQDFKVEGIIFDSAQGSLAVINGVVLKEGDSVGTYKISKIEKGRVQLSQKEEVLWLPFKGGEESD